MPNIVPSALKIGSAIATGYSTTSGAVNVPDAPAYSTPFEVTVVIPEAYRGRKVVVNVSAFITMRSNAFVAGTVPLLLAWQRFGSNVKRDRFTPSGASGGTSNQVIPVPPLWDEFTPPTGSGDYNLTYDFVAWKEGADVVTMHDSENASRMGAAAYLSPNTLFPSPKGIPLQYSNTVTGIASGNWICVLQEIKAFTSGTIYLAIDQSTGAPQLQIDFMHTYNRFYLSVRHEFNSGMPFNKVAADGALNGTNSKIWLRVDDVPSTTMTFNATIVYSSDQAAPTWRTPLQLLVGSPANLKHTIDLYSIYGTYFPGLPKAQALDIADGIVLNDSSHTGVITWNRPDSFRSGAWIEVRFDLNFTASGGGEYSAWVRPSGATDRLFRSTGRTRFDSGLGLNRGQISGTILMTAPSTNFQLQIRMTGISSVTLQNDSNNGRSVVVVREVDKI